jgi:hypothetical protein
MDFNNKLQPKSKMYKPSNQGEAYVYKILKPYLNAEKQTLMWNPNVDQFPRGFNFKAGVAAGQGGSDSGIIDFNGTKYNYDVIGDQLVITDEATMKNKYNNNSSLLMEEYNYGKGK